nr:hypothetical protein [Serratia sp. JSRIV002]
MNGDIAHAGNDATGLHYDMAKAQQAARVNVRVVVAQQVNHGVAPDGFYLFLFKE